MSLCSGCLHLNAKVRNIVDNQDISDVLPSVSLLDGYLFHNIEVRP